MKQIAITGYDLINKRMYLLKVGDPTRDSRVTERT